MKYRVLFLFLAVLALALFVSAPILADKEENGNTHEGKVVSVKGDKLVMVDKEGNNKHTHILADDAKITCNGKECKITDLKPGMFVRVTTKKGDKKVAVRVDAKKKGDEDKNK